VFVIKRKVDFGANCVIIVFSSFPRKDPKQQKMPRVAKVQEICFEYVKVYVMPVLPIKM
jgi:hypothetical protein